jgi:hypothetical protein
MDKAPDFRSWGLQVRVLSGAKFNLFVRLFNGCIYLEKEIEEKKFK